MELYQSPSYSGVKLFESVSNRYTEQGIEFGEKILPLVKAQVGELVDQGYTIRTAMGPASTPSEAGWVFAAAHGLDMREFHALWVCEVCDYVFSSVLGL